MEGLAAAAPGGTSSSRGHRWLLCPCPGPPARGALRTAGAHGRSAAAERGSGPGRGAGADHPALRLGVPLLLQGEPGQGGERPGLDGSSSSCGLALLWATGQGLCASSWPGQGSAQAAPLDPQGLGAPAGAVLAGRRAFVAEAWRVRKLLGGGMRQAGVLAAAARIGLEQAEATLRRDHSNARRFARGTSGPGQGAPARTLGRARAASPQGSRAPGWQPDSPCLPQASRSCSHLCAPSASRPWRRTW